MIKKILIRIKGGHFGLQFGLSFFFWNFRFIDKNRIVCNSFGSRFIKANNHLNLHVIWFGSVFFRFFFSFSKHSNFAACTNIHILHFCFSLESKRVKT